MAFSAHEVLEESWTLSKRTYWTWWPVIIVAVVIPAILSIIGSLFTGWAANVDGFFGAVLGIIGAIFVIAYILAGILMILGLFRNAFAVSGGERPSVARLFETRHYWWFLVAGLIYIAMVTIGLFALILPGLIVAFMLALFPYALIGGQANNGFSALATSWDRITSSFWKYIGLRIVLTGVVPALAIAAIVVLGVLGGGAAVSLDVFNGDAVGGILAVILGVIALVVGVFLYVLALIFTYVSDALAYRRLAPEWAE